MYLELSSEKWRPFCLGLNVLNSKKYAGKQMSVVSHLSSQIKADCIVIDKYGRQKWNRSVICLLNGKGLKLCLMLNVIILPTWNYLGANILLKSELKDCQHKTLSVEARSKGSILTYVQHDDNPFATSVVHCFSTDVWFINKITYRSYCVPMYNHCGGHDRYYSTTRYRVVQLWCHQITQTKSHIRTAARWWAFISRHKPTEA